MKRRNISLDSRQREILGLLLLALGALTLLSLLNVTPGTVSDWWADFLCRLFGWGAYPVALALGAGGVILLAHNLQPGNIIGWKMVIGLELIFLAGLALIHLLSPNPDPLQLAHNGGGGGYVGWAISRFLGQSLGWVTTFMILLTAAVAGLILTFDLSPSQVQRGLISVWEAGLSFYHRLRPPEVTEPRKSRPAPSPKTREPSLSFL